MTWQDLPDGLVDTFRNEAFGLKGDGLIIVRVEGQRFRVDSFREPFFAKLYTRLQELIATHTKADVVILTGRMDKQSGEHVSPQVQVRVYGV